MDIVNIVITEIIVCLVLAWILGFLAAWLIHRVARKKYELTIEELEDNLAYSSACTKNQEREITKQTLKIHEYEKLLEQEGSKLKKAKKDPKKKRAESPDDVILKQIEDNLERANKKQG